LALFCSFSLCPPVTFFFPFPSKFIARPRRPPFGLRSPTEGVVLSLFLKNLFFFFVLLCWVSRPPPFPVASTRVFRFPPPFFFSTHPDIAPSLPFSLLIPYETRLSCGWGHNTSVFFSRCAAPVFVVGWFPPPPF